MWVIMSKKYSNYYAKKISSELKHFVTRIDEAHKWHYKADARKFLNANFKNKDNFELIKY